LLTQPRLCWIWERRGVLKLSLTGEDKVIFVDVDLLPVLETMAPRLPHLRNVVVLTDRAHMPSSAAVPGLVCYEELLHGAVEKRLGRFTWPVFDENTACGLCYTR
jgi:hypothetical protein